MSDLHEARVEAGMRACVLSPEIPTGQRAHLIHTEGVLTIREQVDLDVVVEKILAAADAVVTVEMIADRLARELDGNDGDDLGLAHGEGALHLALDFPIREAIEDVYADCGDSDSRVLSTNIAKRLAYLLPPAVLTLLRGGEER